MTCRGGHLHLTRRPGRRRPARRVMASPPRRPTSPVVLGGEGGERESVAGGGDDGMTCGLRRPQPQRPHTAACAWPPAPDVAVSPRGWWRRPTRRQPRRLPSHTAPTPPTPSILPPRPAFHNQRTHKEHAALPPAPTPWNARAPSGAANFAIQSTMGNGNGRKRSSSHAIRDHTTRGMQSFAEKNDVFPFSSDGRQAVRRASRAFPRP